MRLGVLLAIALACVASRGWAAPLEAYGKLPTIEAVAVSPSGKYVALVTTEGKGHQLNFVEVATGRSASKGDVATAQVKVRDVRWAGEGHLLVITTMTDRFSYFGGPKAEFMIGYNLDLATMKLTQLTPLENRTEAVSALFSTPIVRNVGGKPMIFVQSAVMNSAGSRGLFRIDPATSRSTLVETGDADTWDWVLAADGQAVAQEMYDVRTQKWRLKLRVVGGGWREADTAIAAAGRRPYTLGLGRDGKAILYATVSDGDWSWREASLDKPAETVLEGDPAPIFDPSDGRLLGHFSLNGDNARYTFFDPADTALWTAVGRAFPGDLIHLESWSADRRKIVVLADSATEGPAYAVVDLDTKKATWLGPQYAELTDGDIYPRKAVSFAARDGMQLTGYLTQPKGTPAKPLPLIVFPHGGPASRDTPGFDWWAQAMASRGYAVLQVNFRGSDGLGPALLEAGYGQWGRKMQTDLSDGVRDLAAKGVIDPKRVCIVGASYGGYAALAGATLDPGVYRCAVSVAGLADLRRFVEWARDRNGRDAFRYWNRFMGSEDARDPVLTQVSPAAHVDKVDIPILMIHGRDDTVVPLEQSEAMAAALKAAGKPVELVVQKGGDHWLSSSETRLQMLSATMAFLQKNNPPN